MKNIKPINFLPPTLLLALSGLLSRVLGVFRDHLLAKSFGATGGEGIYNLDTYYAAFRVPDLLYNLLIFGAISAAFIPIFTQYKKTDDSENAWKFASSMLHLMMIGILILSTIAFIFAPQLAKGVAGGFTGEAFDLTVKLMRIMLISPILFTLSSVLVSIQDSFKCFLFRSIGPLFYNLGIIAGIIFFGEKFGVVGVTWGVIIGALLQLIIQLPALWQVKYKHFWILGYNRQDVKMAFKLIIPRILGLSLNQLTLIINTFIASFLMTGSITIFYLADNLQALPLGMIGIAFAITSFATLSELASEPNSSNFALELKSVVQKIIFLTLPATIGMLLLRDQIINVVLVSGKFSASDAVLTTQVLGFLLISLVAQSLIPLLSRGFYAYHNTKTPVLTALTGAIISIFGSYVLAIHFNLGIVGIAMAFSAGSILNFILLYLFMYQKLKHNLVDWMNIFKMMISTFLMTLVVITSKKGMIFEGVTVSQNFIILVLLTIIGAGSYFLFSYLLHIPELRVVIKRK